MQGIVDSDWSMLPQLPCELGHVFHMFIVTPAFEQNVTPSAPEESPHLNSSSPVVEMPGSETQRLTISCREDATGPKTIILPRKVEITAEVPIGSDSAESESSLLNCEP